MRSGGCELKGPVNLIVRRNAGQERVTTMKEKTVSQAFTYYAFISYNHRDEAAAKWLQKRLEHYRLPSVARKEIGEDVKIRPIFRYVSDLGIAVLRERLREELEASRYLIVICSPNSAKPNVKGEHWVNDEVGRFVEMGRGDRIVPVIIDGVPGDDDRECFCPALAAAEISGVDFQKENKSICIQKIVAKLLGLRPDILIQRHLEEVRKRRRRWLWGALPVLALVAAAGLFVWDMLRPVSLYYADYVDSYGLPEGVYEVPKSDLRMRHSTYRFEYSGYYWGGVHERSLPRGWFGVRRKLRRVVHVGATDVPCEVRNEFLKNRLQIMRMDYDGQNRLYKKTICKRGGADLASGVVVKKMHYANRRKGNDTVVNGRMWETFDDESRYYFLKGNITQVKDYDKSDYRTSITHCDIDRDSDGRMVSIRFLASPEMLPACDEDGVYGIKYVLSGHDGGALSGRVVEKQHLDESGSRCMDRYGVSIIRFGYVGPCMTEVEYLDDMRRPVLGRAGFYRTHMMVDGYGNVTNVTLRNRHDKPMYRVLRGGDMARELGGAQIWASCSYVYSNGLMVARSAYKPDGRLLDGKGIVATVRWGYNELGDMVSIETLDSEGRRIINPDGHALVRVEPDPVTGVTKSWRLFGPDGVTPVYHSGQRVFRIDSRYDSEAGEVCEERCFDGDGNIMSCSDGFAIVRCRYDSGGRLQMQTFYDGNTNVCVSAAYGGNVGCVKIEYPRRIGGWRRFSYYADELQAVPAKSKHGVFGEIVKADEQGRIVEFWNISDDGKPMDPNSGAAGWKKEFRRIDRETEILPGRCAEKGWRSVVTSWYDKDRRPFYTAGSCTKEEIYDSKGRLAFEIFKDGENRRVDRSDTGVAVVVSQWDDVGNQIGSFYYDGQGLPASEKGSGSAGYVMEYDVETHRKKAIRYVDASHKTARRFKGEDYSEIRYGTEVKDGREVESVSFWHENVPVQCSQGYHKSLVLKDVFGNNVDEWAYDTEGCATNVVLRHGFAHHHAHAEYDAFRNLTRACRYDVLGRLYEEPGASFCVKEWSYDSLHRCLEMRVIGKPDDENELRPTYEDYPGCDMNGVSLMRLSYHGNTRVVARKDEFGMKDSPCLYGAAGVWQKVEIYDTDGIKTKERMYSVSGEVLGELDLGRKGDAGVEPSHTALFMSRTMLAKYNIYCERNVDKAKVTLDRNGRLSDIEFLDADGKVVAGMRGSARVKQIYRGDSNVAVRRDYLGLREDPRVDGVPGLWRKSVTVNEKGLPVRESYYNLAGKLMLGADGYAECISEYDSAGRLAKKVRLGIDGRLKNGRYGYAFAEYKYDKDGRCTEAGYFDGNQVRIASRPVAAVKNVIPGENADTRGVRAGDILCGFGTYDINASCSIDNLRSQIIALRNKEKTLVFARRVKGRYEILKIDFPVGMMGIEFEDVPFADGDDLIRAYRAFRATEENEKRQ